MAWTLVTGGAKRLGAEICRMLAQKGHNILVHYRTSGCEARQVQKQCRHFGVEAACVQGDFSTIESVRTFAKELNASYPRIEVLVNNVGSFFVGSALETPQDKWLEIFQLNLHAPVALTKVLVPSLKAEQGSIINIGVAGVQSIRADVHYTCYRMAKMSLLMLTKSLAKELASSQVRVNMVSPGELTLSCTLSQNGVALPMKRAGTPEEVAKAVAFLLEKDSRYMTGQNIEVAGGVAL